MSAEKLKVIAEGMGYEVKSESYITAAINEPDTYILIVKKPEGGITHYNPDTINDTQCMEIMEKLKISTYSYLDGKWASRICTEDGNDYFGEGNTINEAVCNAAYDYFKGEQE